MYYMYLYPNGTPYDRHDLYDGHQEHRHRTVTAAGWSAYGGRDSWHPSITCILYSHNRIVRLRWPALL